MGLEFWRVGQLRPATIKEESAQLERAGWDGILMGDNQCLVGDCYVGLAVAATATSTLKLGVGVTNPVTRHPSLTAAAAANLQQISGGRMVLGMGRGDSSLAHIGLAPATPARFETYVRHVQAYLRGEGVPLEELDRNGHRTSSELRAAGVPEESRLRWLDPAAPKVPVDIAASGPAVIEIAARHGDRVTFGVGADHERLTWAMDTARTARAAAGLDPDMLSFGAFVNVVPHPDQAVALDLAAIGVATFSRFSIMHGKTSGPMSEANRAVLQSVSNSYDLRQHASGDASHRNAVSAEYITSFGVVGTPAQCADRLVRLSELGLDRVVILGAYPDASPESERHVQVSREVLAAEVFPSVREKLS
jgi:5,10-methylenetetrahydromethanopterin reductase